MNKKRIIRIANQIADLEKQFMMKQIDTKEYEEKISIIAETLSFKEMVAIDEYISRNRILSA